MTSKVYIIYKFTNKTNNKAYIGLTFRDLEIRTYEHVRQSVKCKKERKFYKAIKKYKFENFTSTILESNILGIKQANKREIYYIEKYNTYKKGYNMTKGGGGRDNYYFSLKSRKKMSEAKLGTKHSKETCFKVSLALKGRKKSKEHVEKVRQSNLGKKRSKESKLKMSLAQKGKHSKEKAPGALKVSIFNNKGEIKFKCHGNFNPICQINNLPRTALRKSYLKNGLPIYLGKTIKKEVLIKNKEFIGWYAKLD